VQQPRLNEVRLGNTKVLVCRLKGRIHEQGYFYGPLAGKIPLENPVDHAGNLLVFSTIYFFLVVLFTYFYTAITFDPDEISKNLQKNGGFIPGIRPGENTRKFISKITYRITLFGAIFLGIIAILPNATQAVTGIATLTMGGTALLIVVSVVIETVRQIESQLTMREYEGF